jgi:hypothetical protein
MRNTSLKYLKLAIVAGLFAATAVASPVQAGKYSNFADAMKHFIECANWLVSDPAKHAEFCDPGHDVIVSSSTGYATVYKNPCDQGLVAETVCVD